MCICRDSTKLEDDSPDNRIRNIHERRANVRNKYDTITSLKHE